MSQQLHSIPYIQQGIVYVYFMVDFVSTGIVELLHASKRVLQNEKFLSTVEFDPGTVPSDYQTLYQLPKKANNGDVVLHLYFVRTSACNWVR